ncbi:MAG: helix-turn-helix transcriptional regulator [Provencibacterium sp.]|jgi:transcriptional regulator with XRE-family HTH domain|nr:helix-turn-helix transcriptional regulator [Provencibacterium sp.]
MENTLGARIAQYRRRANMTQEQLAEYMEVSPQAVSKWENDLTCPDIAALPKLAELFQISVDMLLRGEAMQEARMLSPEEKKNIDGMLLRIRGQTVKGDRVKVNLPVALVKVALEIGLELPQFEGQEILQKIDLEKIIRLVDEGAIGKLVEVESAEGDIVEITVS